MSYPWENSKPSNSKRRWNYFKDRLIDQFGCLVYKVGVDAGFDCPNRDGTKGFGGCAYCSQEGSLSPHQDPELSIKKQLEKGIEFCASRYKSEKFIAYFQSFTNTYDKLEILKQRFEAALDVDKRVVGLSIATRPDCVNEEHIEYLASLNEKLDYFTLELGLQSVYQNRLEWVNRKESVQDYINAMELLNKYKIPVITHVILGFPGETKQEMFDAVKLADQMKTQGIKLQMLHVIKKTKLEYIYKLKKLQLFSQDEYINLIIHLLERINPQTVIHRITGETERAKLVAPLWVQHKTQVFSKVDNILEQTNSWQGKFYNN